MKVLRRGGAEVVTALKNPNAGRKSTGRRRVGEERRDRPPLSLKDRFCARSQERYVSKTGKKITQRSKKETSER